MRTNIGVVPSRCCSGVLALISLTAFLLAVTNACSGGAGKASPVAPILSAINLAPASSSCKPGDTIQLFATGHYSDGSAQALSLNSVTWGSSAPAVAAVAATGVVTCSGQGTATIAASSGSISGQSTVTVAAPAPPPVPALTGISLAPLSSLCKPGDRIQLGATGHYSDGSAQALSSNSMTWASSAPTVAAVAATGVVTCEAQGMVSITGTSASLSAQSTVNVVEGPAPGTLDTSFGGSGYLTTEVANLYSSATAVAIQSDGKILAVGAVPYSYAVVRYNSDGSLDQTFGSGGYVTTPSGYGSGPGALAIDAKGRIIVAGSYGVLAPSGTTYNYAFALVRYNPDGSLDATFGSGAGYVITTINNSNSCFANAVAIQSDGKIVAGGRVDDNNNITSTAVIRYNDDGSLDPTFGGVGYVTTPLGYAAGAMAIQSDGRIVVATTNMNSVARYNADGSLDQTFGAGGYVLSQQGLCTLGGAMSLQSDGKVVTAGECSSLAVIMRYQSNGSVDPTFGGTGVVHIPVGVESNADAVTVQSNGQIVMAGSSRNSSGLLTATLARVNTDGSLDTTFGNGVGYVITPLMQNYNSWLTGVAIQPDDQKIVVVGDTFYLNPQTNAAHGYLAIARYWP